MGSLAETLVRRHLPQDAVNFKMDKLNGGISSEVYKVEYNNSEGVISLPVAVTILRDSEMWWKLEKEKLIRDIISNDPEVLLPELKDLGVDTIGNTKVAFLVSQFVAGSNLDSFLEHGLSGSPGKGKFTGLINDLGYRIGVLHKHHAGVFGMIGYAPEQYSSWQEYILAEFSNEVRLITQLDPNLQIGAAKSGKLQTLLSPLQQLVGRFQSSLISQESKISHGDARFGNFIADNTSDKNWRIAGMVDLESMLGGDPEIDIAFMENWLHFSTYKEEFFSQQQSFIDGYQKMRSPSSVYSQKRFIYHTLRTLAYLRTVFGFDIKEFVNADPKHQKYVEQHMEIAQSLAKGNYLEDLNIKALI